MPNEDKTGPNGIGPMSGKGLGKCNTQVSQVSSNTNFQRGKGFGRICGRGCNREFGCGRGQERRFFLENQNSNKTNKETLLQELKAKKAEIDKAINEIEQKN